MLIDIEKYVRQLLPPNRRLPKHIGLTTTLFQPIESIIDQFNDFKYDSQFDTGTPGQVAVLEYILQSYVHSNIKVLSADGARIDFRILIPEALNIGERAEVIRIVERYRLRSKRYEVSVVADWGNGGGDPIFNLAWLGTPYIVTTESSFTLIFGVNKVGQFPTKVVNTTTGIVVFDDLMEFNGTDTFSLNLPGSGTYRAGVGSLSASVQAIAENLTTVKPAWLQKVAFTYEPNSHDFSKWVTATEDVEVMITPKSGLVIRGTTTGNIAWSGTTYIAGTTDWAAPFSEVFRANPASFGDGGIIPGQYTAKIRRTSHPSEVFAYSFSVPVSVVNQPQEIPLNAVDPGNSCELGPLFAGAVTITATRADWGVDARNVKSLKVRISQAGSVLRSATIAMVTETGQAIFSPSNRPFWNYAALSPGTYNLEMEGGSCSSAVVSRSFTIGGTTTPTDPGGPVLPDAELLGTYSQIVGDHKFTYNRSFGMTIQINQDKTITVNTPGLDRTQVPNKLGGSNVFWYIDYKPFCDNQYTGAPTYRSFENIYLPAPAKAGETIEYTIRQLKNFTNSIQNIDQLIERGSGYPLSNGVNKYNVRVSEITVSIERI